MISRLAGLFQVVAASVLIDLGLILVFIDSAFRGYMPIIQYSALPMVVGFPMLVVVTLLNPFHKGFVIVSFIVATLIIFYLAFFYKQRMFTDPFLILVTVGFLVAVFLLWRRWTSIYLLTRK